MKSLVLDRNYVLNDSDLFLDGDKKRYVLKIKDLESENKPREKLINLGPKNLTGAELVAIILGVGTRKEEVLSMAQRILKEYGEKTIINDQNPKNLAEALDIPVSKACQIIACFELGRRFFQKKEGRAVFIRTPKQVFEYLKEMGGHTKEHLRGLYLNSRYQVIHDETISIGSLTSSVIHPREIFQPAIEHSAVAVIIAHNHPSGNLSPTNSDIAVTRQIMEAGSVLGIELLDHLIIAGDRYFSIMDGMENVKYDL